MPDTSGGKSFASGSLIIQNDKLSKAVHEQDAKRIANVALCYLLLTFTL